MEFVLQNLRHNNQQQDSVRHPVSHLLLEAILVLMITCAMKRYRQLQDNSCNRKGNKLRHNTVFYRKYLFFSNPSYPHNEQGQSNISKIETFVMLNVGASSPQLLNMILQ